MKKFIPLVVVGLVVLCGIEAVALPFKMTETNIQEWKQTPYTSLNKADILDQSQPDFDFGMPVGYGTISNSTEYFIVAQSFIPTLNLLTRVELMIGKLPTALYDYTVAIRDDLNGSDLTSVSLATSEISINFDWEEFNFPDIMVIPGNTYYIVSATPYAIDSFYFWAGQFGNVYLNGTMYYTITNEVIWIDESILDMTFKTYGYNNLPPDKPIISGKTSGKTKIKQQYKINTIDPEGNNVFYFVDWGDGTNSSWLGSYDSGEEITAKHVWDVKGNYTIKVKAKDIYGKESVWSDPLPITMPYSYKPPFIQCLDLLFQRFPHAFPILRHLMGY